MSGYINQKNTAANNYHARTKENMKLKGIFTAAAIIAGEDVKISTRYLLKDVVFNIYANILNLFRGICRGA